MIHLRIRLCKKEYNGIRQDCRSYMHRRTAKAITSWQYPCRKCSLNAWYFKALHDFSLTPEALPQYIYAALDIKRPLMLCFVRQSEARQNVMCIPRELQQISLCEP